MKRIILSVAVITVVALGFLAACGKSEEKEAVKPSVPDQSQLIQDAAPLNDADARAQEAELIESLREKSGIVTPEQQAAILERVRMNAEAAAKTVGQTEQQALQAGEAAVAAAKRSFENTQP